MIHTINLRGLIGFFGIGFLLWGNLNAGRPFQFAHHLRQHRGTPLSDENPIDSFALPNVNDEKRVDCFGNVKARMIPITGSPTESPSTMVADMVTIDGNHSAILNPSTTNVGVDNGSPPSMSTDIAMIDGNNNSRSSSSTILEDPTPSLDRESGAIATIDFVPMASAPGTTPETNTTVEPSSSWERVQAMAIGIGSFMLLGVAGFLYRQSWVNERLAWVNENSALQAQMRHLQYRVTKLQAQVVRHRERVLSLRATLVQLKQTNLLLKNQVCRLQDRVCRLFTVDVMGLSNERRATKQQHGEALAVAYSGGVADGHVEI